VVVADGDIATKGRPIKEVCGANASAIPRMAAIAAIDSRIIMICRSLFFFIKDDELLFL
jgi:hypothetical protein